MMWPTAMLPVGVRTQPGPAAVTVTLPPSIAVTSATSAPIAIAAPFAGGIGGDYVLTVTTGSTGLSASGLTESTPVNGLTLQPGASNTSLTIKDPLAALNTYLASGHLPFNGSVGAGVALTFTLKATDSDGVDIQSIRHDTTLTESFAAQPTVTVPRDERYQGPLHQTDRDMA